MPRLKNKTALVTGAARGIGEAISSAFKAEGAHVFMTDIDEDAGSAAAARIAADFRRLDVREESD